MIFLVGYLYSIYQNLKVTRDKNQGHAGQKLLESVHTKKKNTLRILTINLSSDASRDLLINVPVFSVFSERISKDCQKKKQKNKRKICTS